MWPRQRKVEEREHLPPPPSGAMDSLATCPSFNSLTRSLEFTAALLTVARTRKQSKRSSADACIKKIWRIPTTKPSAIKSNDLPFEATCVDLESVVLSEIRQRKVTTVWYLHYLEINTSKR